MIGHDKVLCTYGQIVSSTTNNLLLPRDLNKLRSYFQGKMITFNQARLPISCFKSMKKSRRKKENR